MCMYIKIPTSIVQIFQMINDYHIGKCSSVHTMSYSTFNTSIIAYILYSNYFPNSLFLKYIKKFVFIDFSSSAFILQKSGVCVGHSKKV